VRLRRDRWHAPRLTAPREGSAAKVSSPGEVAEWLKALAC
jgi:hypothetical protein